MFIHNQKLPRLHKIPYKYRFSSSSSHYSTTKLSIIRSSALCTIKNFVINCSTKAFENRRITGEKCMLLLVISNPNFDFLPYIPLCLIFLLRKSSHTRLNGYFKISECEYKCTNSFMYSFSNIKQTKKLCQFDLP